MNKRKIKRYLIKLVQFITNPRFLLCFGLAWIITNGWSYIMMAVGTYFKIGWMMAVASAYLAFLWLPISPEKVLTLTIAMLLLSYLFPNDKKTLAVLKQLHKSAKRKARDLKEKVKNKKNEP